MSAAAPPIRTDGRCAMCPKPRTFSGLKPLYREAAERDPFCSSRCARAWHGCALPERERVSVEGGDAP